MRPDQLKEVAALSKTYNSPFMVKMHDKFLSSNRVYLIIDYCANGSLRQKIRQLQDEQKPFSEAETTFLLTQVIHGLAALHKQHVIHCDLKPDNIVFSKDGTVRIIDFGTAIIDPTPQTVLSAAFSPFVYLFPIFSD